jgi:hypothetical protein
MNAQCEAQNSEHHISIFALSSLFQSSTNCSGHLIPASKGSARKGVKFKLRIN